MGRLKDPLVETLHPIQGQKQVGSRKLSDPFPAVVDKGQYLGKSLTDIIASTEAW